MSDSTDSDKDAAKLASTDPLTSHSTSSPPPVALEAHAFINMLLASKDPAARALELVGFLGPVDKCGNVRLYPKLDLCACYQFPATMIRHAEPPDPTDPTRPSKIVVDCDTNVEIVLSLESSVLDGAMTDTHKLDALKRHAIPFLKASTRAPCHIGGKMSSTLVADESS
jgi:hypothetical protein